MNVMRSRMLEPIVIPRWMLVVKYGLFALLGVVLIRAGSPSIERATTADYLIWYGSLLSLAALAALVGSLTREWVEVIGALSLWSLLLVYVFTTAERALAGEAGIQAVSIIILLVSMLPMARGFSLLLSRIRARNRKRRPHAR